MNKQEMVDLLKIIEKDAEENYEMYKNSSKAEYYRGSLTAIRNLLVAVILGWKD